MKPNISIIVAHDDKLGIGKNNQLLWHIAKDLKKFKKITTNHPVIMGRKTFESIGKPLPKRDNIIITRNFNYQTPGCHVVDSIKKAIILASSLDDQEIFIIGGGEIYKQALPLADKLYITKVKGDFKADIFFPEYPQFTKEIFSEKSNQETHTYTFLELTK